MGIFDVDFLSSLSFTGCSSKCSWNKTLDEKLAGFNNFNDFNKVAMWYHNVISVRYITVTPLAACNMINVIILPDVLLRCVFTNQGCTNIDVLNYADLPLVNLALFFC